MQSLHLFVVTGKSPQNPPTATSPDPRLMALGATYGFGGIMIRSKIKKLATSVIASDAVRYLVKVTPPALIVGANKFPSMIP